jgi:hypothetical protein
MSLRKAPYPRDQEEGRSLLQGLMILAVIGIVITVVISHFA